MNLSSWWLNQPIKNKYARQIGSFPQVGRMNIQKYFSCHHLVVCIPWKFKTKQSGWSLGWFIFKDSRSYQWAKFGRVGLPGYTLIRFHLFSLTRKGGSTPPKSSSSWEFSSPISSMYGIFPYIYHKNQPNVGKYTIHGWYGSGNPWGIWGRFVDKFVLLELLEKHQIQASKRWNRWALHENPKGSNQRSSETWFHGIYYANRRRGKDI